MVLRLRYLILICVLPALMLQTGCHQRLVNEPLRRPDWGPTASEMDGELSRFLAKNPALTVQQASADSGPLTLPRMRWLALQNNPAVIAARGELTAATAMAGSAGNWPDPEIDSRYLTDGDGSSELEAALIFGIPWSGRAAARGKAAGYARELARIEFDSACQAALLELDQALSELAWATERLAMRQDLAARSKHFAELTRSRQEANVADPLDAALIIADAATDQRAVIRSRLKLKTIKHNLALKLGIAPNKWWLDTLPLIPPRVDLELATVEQAAGGRRAWLSARAAYQMSEWEAAAASRERIPDLSLGPVLTSADSESRYGVTAGIALPIFSGAGSHYQAALARRDSAYQILQQEARSTAVEIKNRTSYLNATTEELELLGQEPLTAAEDALALAGERYGAGQVDILLLLSAHRAYSTLKLELLDRKSVV